MRCDHGDLIASAGCTLRPGFGLKFETRKTDREPTKSGVVGLLAAALGLAPGRHGGPCPLNGLRFAVRADQEGSLLVDFHTAKSRDTSYVTYRHYLQDAVFLAGWKARTKLCCGSWKRLCGTRSTRCIWAALRRPPCRSVWASGRGAWLDVLRTEPMQGTKTGNREAAHRGRRRPGRPWQQCPGRIADVLQPGASAVRVPSGAGMAAGPAGNAGTDGARPHGGIAELR